MIAFFQKKKAPKESITHSACSCKNELELFKAFSQNEIQQLKNQNKHILKKIETFPDKIKSFEDLKRELIALFSINGYSELLNTNSLVIKLFSLICLTTLFACCLLYVDLNVKSFQAYDVVTQIKLLFDESRTFPAVTFCLYHTSTGRVTSKNLSDVFHQCSFGFRDSSCTLDDFEVTSPKFDQEYGIDYYCYKFNGGRNSSHDETKLLASPFVGLHSGLSMIFNLSRNHTLFYFVADNKVEPLDSEIYRSIELKEQGYLLINLKKIVNRKLPIPYSNCSEDVNRETSDLVKKILAQNVTYRQKNCYDLCYNEYVNAYADLRNMTKREAYKEVLFDYNRNCSHRCPLECDSTSFESSTSSATLTSELGNIEDFFSVEVNIFYSELEYTEISQAVKTSGADLVSNTGGVLGLFLDISFYHAYQLVNYIFGLIF